MSISYLKFMHIAYNIVFIKNYQHKTYIICDKNTSPRFLKIFFAAASHFNFAKGDIGAAGLPCAKGDKATIPKYNKFYPSVQNTRRGKILMKIL